MTVAEETAPGATLQIAAAVKLHADIAPCESPDHLDAICKLVWAAHFANELPEHEATFLAACIPLCRALVEPAPASLPRAGGGGLHFARLPPYARDNA
ncbi:MULTISPECIES: hypothetical protein [Bradyrhizobium]|uniref:hypothetical protein n=1 Tax=Bradyrhizobium centrosematis TaxID=1300039 RepID=UPI002168EDC9|nr:hypothetical protein [Bradyrhizobium centrosematis]MCS3764822.1 hypothetical protein [Bradyrhizobium centrosematis]MCS3776126.1 hypothetical protein [Bradyrhizobium centrosematis]